MAVGELDDLDTSLLAQGANQYVALAATANVVMQLSNPGVGRGVAEADGQPGSLFADPRRRRRTTASFLSVAVLGSATERAAFRAAVNGSHAPVRSAAGASVAYSAFDPELQRWVGACLYRLFEEAREVVHGPLAGVEREAFYRQGVIFGGMLQMPAGLWPGSRAEFEEYWADSVATAVAGGMDDTVRSYLDRVIELEYLRRDVPEVAIRLRRWLVSGHLDPALRPLVGLSWQARDQRRLRRIHGGLGATVRRLSPERQRALFSRELRDVQARLAAAEDLLAPRADADRGM